MKVSLNGMIANCATALRRGDKSMGDYYAFSLEELHQHIRELVEGKHTLEEFAEHYCIKKETPVPTSEMA